MNKIDDITMRRKAYAICRERHIPLEDALEHSRFFAEQVNEMIADEWPDEKIWLILMIYRFPVDYLAL